VPFALLARFKIEVPNNHPIVLENLLCSNSGHRSNSLEIVAERHDYKTESIAGKSLPEFDQHDELHKAGRAGIVDCTQHGSVQAPGEEYTSNGDHEGRPAAVDLRPHAAELPSADDNF